MAETVDKREGAGIYDVEAIRPQFPGLQGEANDRPLVYLDSAATSQKPEAVIRRMDRFLREEYGTVHRGMYARSVQSTALYEDARKDVARFLGAASEREIVFTMGCTDAINLVAASWGRANLGPGKRVLITAMEHHSNIVPWQLACEHTGAELVHCPVLDDGSLDLEAFERLCDERVALVAMIHVSNSLGTVNPVAELTAQAHAVGARVLVDGAQSAPHMAVDVQALDCDFFTCSAHKLYGPTGIGALYAKLDVLEAMPPYRGGGEMIEKVTLASSTYAPPPARFEAGTPPIVEAIGFGAACRWLEDVGMEAIDAHERTIYPIAEAALAEIPGIRRIGTAPERRTALSFVMDRFCVPATARISLGCYTTEADLEAARRGLHKVADLFAQ